MGVFDKVLSWSISKKLLVLVVATVLALNNQLNGSEWVNVAMVYIGFQAAIDAIIQLRKK